MRKAIIRLFLPRRLTRIAIDSDRPAILLHALSAARKTGVTVIRPFIIFAQERTGSSTLLLLLNCHPAVKCLFEPFSPGNTSPYAAHCDTLRNTHGLEAAILWLFRGCNAFKHVWKRSGWPFENAPDDNRRILLCGATIIFLSRKNALRRAISSQISEQMGVWVRSSNIDSERIRAHQFQPLDIPRLRNEIAGSQKLLAEYRAALSAGSIPWREWTYEDFFASAMSLDARMHAVQNVLAFLGLPPVSEPDRLAKMHGFLDPTATGFQNEQAYNKIPNIQEVEKELGNDQTGFIFKT